MKKVIFVGGTSRSGSTILDVVLSNNKEGFSLGEINALFKPFKRKHISFKKELTEKDGKWRKIIKDGENKLYENLFNLYPEKEYFVDSSKDVFWISKQNKILKQKGIKYYNILIYKDPYEISASFSKRGLDWRRSYINYHTNYFSLIKPDIVVSYKNFVTNKQTIQKICYIIGIEFVEGQDHYDYENSHTFFGSSSIRKFNELKYQPITDTELIKKVELELKEKKIQKVWNLLKEKEIDINEPINFKARNKLFLNLYQTYFLAFRKLNLLIK